MYLMIGSRPDIGFAVVKLAQQMANPSNDHYRVGLHPLDIFLPLADISLSIMD